MIAAYIRPLPLEPARLALKGSAGPICDEPEPPTNLNVMVGGHWGPRQAKHRTNRAATAMLDDGESAPPGGPAGAGAAAATGPVDDGGHAPPGTVEPDAMSTVQGGGRE